MAIVKSFEDACGNPCPASYWRATSINIDAKGMEIGVVFAGWRDAEAFAGGKQPLAGAVKSYRIFGAEFLAVAASAPVGASLYDVLANASESYALAKLDTPTGEADGDGLPVLASFFAGAERD